MSVIGRDQLLFADDVIISESTEQLPLLVEVFGGLCESKSMRVSVDESKLIVMESE